MCKIRENYFFSEKEDKEEKREIGTQRWGRRERGERSEEGWGKKIIETLVLNNVTPLQEL